MTSLGVQPLPRQIFAIFSSRSIRAVARLCEIVPASGWTRIAALIFFVVFFATLFGKGTRQGVLELVVSLRTPFLPSPLIEKLGSEGFRSRVQHQPDGAWAVNFWRDE
jgi:hypothetical protein